MRNRIKAYVGPNAARDALRDGHWWKAMAGVRDSINFCGSNGVPLVTRAAGENVNITGGAIVPASFDAAIIRVVEAQSAFSHAEQRTATSDGAIRPRRTGGVVASWTAEGQSIPESSFSGDLIDVAAAKLGILVRFGSELYEDAAPDLAEFLAEEFGFAIAGAVDNAGFNGDGTSQFGGTYGLFPKLVGKKSNVAAASHAQVISNDRCYRHRRADGRRPRIVHCPALHGTARTAPTGRRSAGCLSRPADWSLPTTPMAQSLLRI